MTTITIDQESGRQKRQSIDIDNMRERLKTTNNILSFPSPSIATIEKNLFYLLRNSKQINFDAQYSMKPEYLSYDEYGTYALWQLILYVNNIFSKEDFVNLSMVIIPSFSSIVSMAQDNYTEKNPDNFSEVDW